uniref:GP-PDE domain-containing protein n=1 Tax=Mucochytrium quahogii TaxID=96639 RepID=A0A7S2S279_9STRA|mmetsp:Transcript_8289/g.13446  ORF Transcript_8289/g.13446 Transcript_8289/m.13446 type:complete len:381 (-) Transcript_8289:1499-2641(-)|eukprot:CAMPEP_0203744674 /NCGR_PEP_ID=MMETSP0098-20131031/664_1 /ASSEMBLY_ACC=CAM_ASM_000208 /TAXON_ID=96639 /ORGANISM=" , Strain NY0313808BC1" /LENGTH=380 /DNA_ID=CAMNT_0050632253 /DNA_START=109 /DNA_END=1251 /DNA_ORIENTATION=+
MPSRRCNARVDDDFIERESLVSTTRQEPKPGLWIQALDREVCSCSRKADDESDGESITPKAKRKRKVGLVESCVFVILVCAVLTFALAIQQSSCWNAKDEFGLYNSLIQKTGEEFEKAPFPLAHALSHNDNFQAVPIQLALGAGFCGLEVDVFANKYSLFVGSAESNEKLIDSYLRPLAKVANVSMGPLNPLSIRTGICKQNTLLVDVKSNSVLSWEVLEKQLRSVNAEFGFNVFECYDSRGIPVKEWRIKGGLSPIKVIITGVDLDKVPLLAERMVKDTADGLHCQTLDGRWGDTIAITNDENARRVQSMISARWDPVRFNGDALKNTVHLAHEHNYRIRFWDTPENIETWSMLLEAGVDLISTDRIAGLQAYLSGKKY